MRIGFVVNDIATEQSNYTTTRLALSAVNRGHEPWLIGAGDLAMDPDDQVRARARSAPKKRYKSTETFLQELRGDKAKLILSTVPNLNASLALLSYLRRRKFKGVVIVTVRGVSDAKKCYKAGATYVIVPSVLGARKFGELFKKRQTGKKVWMDLGVKEQD